MVGGLSVQPWLSLEQIQGLLGSRMGASLWHLGGGHPGLSFPFNSMCHYIFNIKSVRMSMPGREGLWG